MPGPPLPPPPDPGESQHVRRHIGMYCGCSLIDCLHNESDHRFESGAADRERVHYSGSPQSGYLYPWEPGDESWRDTLPPLPARQQKAPA